MQLSPDTTRPVSAMLFDLQLALTADLHSYRINGCTFGFCLERDIDHLARLLMNNEGMTAVVERA